MTRAIRSTTSRSNCAAQVARSIVARYTTCVGIAKVISLVVGKLSLTALNDRANSIQNIYGSEQENHATGSLPAPSGSQVVPTPRESRT